MATPQPSAFTVLYLESDETLRRTVSAYLHGYGFTVVEADRLSEARGLLAEHRFDAVLLDIIVQGEDASVALTEFPARSDAAIFVATERTEEADRVMALELGADYCVSKPLKLRELVAQLRAACRRTNVKRVLHGRPRRAVTDGWTFDISAHRAEAPGRIVDLTFGEAAVLRALLEHPLQVLSRHHILSTTRRDDAEVFDRTVDVLVSRLRHKLEADAFHPVLIETIRGEGYRFSRAVHWIE